MKSLFSLFAFLFCQSFLWSQTIHGTVLDAKTKQPMGHAAVQVAGTLAGTVTNEDGAFDLNMPKGKDSIIVAFLGYQNEVVVVGDHSDDITVYLRPIDFTLEEVIVRSMTPEEYIIEAVGRYDELFPSTPFSTTGYFSEKAAIRNPKGKFYKNTETIFTSYFEDYIDTTKEALNVLNKYRIDTSELFSSILEDNKRIQKWSEDEDGEVDIELPTGEGPSLVLEVIQGAPSMTFMNESHFKKIKFEFGENTSYLGRPLITIDFKTKRRIDRAHYEGSIYLDYETLAIVSINYTQAFKMPFYVNALLRTFVGFRIKDIYMDLKLHNQPFERKWYPKDVLGQIRFKFKQKGDEEQWVVRQAYSLSNINLDTAAPPQPEHIYDKNKEMKKQLHNPDNIQWEDVNVIP